MCPSLHLQIIFRLYWSRPVSCTWNESTARLYSLFVGLSGWDLFAQTQAKDNVEILPHSPVSVANMGQDLLSEICSTSVLYRVGRWGWARCECCVKSVLSNCGCSFELWSFMLQVLICVLRLSAIIGSLITPSLRKMERILMKTSERSQTNLFQKYLICVLQQQHSSGLTSSGVETQTVKIWVTDFAGIHWVLLYPAVIVSAENICGTHSSWPLSPWQFSELGELGQGWWYFPRRALCTGFGLVSGHSRH